MVTTPKTQVRLAGIGMVLVVLGAVSLTYAFYTGAFRNSAEITLVTGRAGLVMDPGNKVKMRGVEIGRVGSVIQVGDTAELQLEIDRDEFSRIPSTTTAEVRSTTIFGAKYVELVAPERASAELLAEGGVIRATDVTTEVNTVFEGLNRVLSGIDVANLNSTLTTLAETLAGNGDDVAALAQQADAYLTRLEPLLPQLRRDLRQAARFSRLGVEISPDLLAILRNATVTAGTVVEKEASLQRLLVDMAILGRRGAHVLGVHGDALGELLRSLRPTVSTLRVYSSELPCLLQGAARTRELAAGAIGGTDPGMRVLFGARSALPKYTFPRDLPKFPRGRGPACHGLPVLTPQDLPAPERGEPQ